MKSLKLLNGDLVIENGDFVMIDGDDEKSQRISEIIGVNLGEWFLDESLGIDFSLFFEKPLNREAIEDGIVEAIQSRVDDIERVEIDEFEIVNRKLTIIFRAYKTDGTSIEGESVVNV
ncbi:DUF2634 domain-containing protein [Metabacillus litoralis]|uniref:DUF2634 domain-containing protein n=1 Tax=Metabacillus litoralis TaxID=152268 RepID=UPI002040B6C4|nr:DUF2634 domain-containing protein [Metabacillus litoralis]MCM3413514.1 DUF2634 domain-containing protein [Metabacillus litoralis]